MKLRLLLLSVLIAFVCRCAGQDTQTIFRLGIMPKAPAIDGIIQEAEWNGAVPVFGFNRYKGSALSSRQGTFRIGFTANYIYYACRSELPPKGMKLRSKIARNGRDIYKDDTAELLFYSPLKDHVYHLGFNPKGKFFSTKYQLIDNSVTHTKMLPWNPKIRAASKMHDGVWDLEVAVPLASIGFKPGRLPLGKWGIQMVRGFRQPNEDTSLTATSMFCRPENMAELTVDTSAPAAGFLTMGSEFLQGHYDMEFPVYNSTGKPVEVECAVNVTSSAAPHFLNRTAVVPHGKSHLFRLKFDESAASVSTYDLKAVLKDVKSGKLLFQRAFAWKPTSNDRWAMEKKRDTEFEFAFYPSYNKMKARCGNPQVKADPAIQSVRFRILDGQKELSAADAVKKPYGFYALWDTGKLPDGKFSLEAVLTRADGKKVVKTASFENKHFPWENNRIGKDRIIIPPFKPLQVDDGKREIHALQTGYRAGKGFWDAVYAQGVNILDSPVGFRVDDKSDYFAEKSFRFTEKSPDRVVTESAFAGKDVSFKMTSEYDYDGMCKVTVKFNPSKEWKAESLTLDIPLKAGCVDRFHGIQGVAHFHPARFLKKEQGVIWQPQGERTSPKFQTPFWPYLWVGGLYKGFAWFADSDKNWSLAPDKASAEIIRKGETVLVRIHIFNQPTVRNKPFEVIMGFQPTPVKPRPADWRIYTDRWKPVPHARMLVNLCGAYMWGTYRPSDPFPINHDYSVARMLSKENRRKTAKDKKFVDDFIQRNCGKLQPDEIRRIRIHLERSQSLAANAAYMYPYMNPTSGADAWEDYRVFQDEWHLAEFRNPVDYDEYSISSSKSQVDYLLWNAKKLIDAGLDGIYYDNCGGGSLSLDPVTSSAWELPDGRIQPSMGFFSRRELVKRTATMLCQTGRTIFSDQRPLLELHTTNGIAVPYLSFAAFQLDLERGYGPTEFHERFTPEHIMTETLGTQTGCAPLVLCCLTGSKKEWLTRTFLCYSLAFDLPCVMWQYPGGPVFKKIWRMLYEFGYGTDEVSVLTDWNENPHPVTTKDKNAKITVYQKRKTGECLAAVCDFGKKNRTLELDLSGLQFKSPAVFNAESGKELSVKGQLLKLELPRHDFRMLKIREAGSGK